MSCTTSLADEAPGREQWLWPQRVALGTLTLLVGDPDIGKSYLTLDMAARVSRGALWPEEELAASSAETGQAAPIREPGSVFLACAEDDFVDTVRPRLVALGADLKKIRAMRNADGDQAFDLLARLSTFREELQSTPDTRLWIIDPISSYLGSLKENDDRSVRSLINPLANLAAAHRLAIVLVTHLSKGDGKALHRVLGSRAIGAAARNVWLVYEDDQDRRRRHLVSMKNNRTATPTGLTFTIERVGTSGYATLRWAAEPVLTSADDALEAAAYRSPPRNQLRRKVIAWLKEILADGPLPPDIVRDSAQAVGISYTTLRRAFHEMGGQSIWRREGQKSTRLWQLGPETDAG